MSKAPKFSETICAMTKSNFNFLIQVIIYIKNHFPRKTIKLWISIKVHPWEGFVNDLIRDNPVRLFGIILRNKMTEWWYMSNNYCPIRIFVVKNDWVPIGPNTLADKYRETLKLCKGFLIPPRGRFWSFARVSWFHQECQAIGKSYPFQRILMLCKCNIFFQKELETGVCKNKWSTLSSTFRHSAQQEGQ